MAVEGGWGQITAPPPIAAVGAPGWVVSPMLAAQIAAVLAELGHTQATAHAWDTHSVSATTNNPVLASGAHPKRIAVSVQLPSGLLAYMGPDNTVSALSTANGAGYVLPSGGGFLFGPENTLDVWVVHANVATQDIRVLELWRA